MLYSEIKFPQRNWEGKWRAVLLVQEFIRSDEWRSIKLTPPPAKEDEIEAELEELIKLKDKRKELTEDIKAQDTAPWPWFYEMLPFTDRSAPKTEELMRGALTVGTNVAMYFKAQFDRARPSQLRPEIRPMLPVPGHSAYPSGHSTQMHLIAHALSLVVPHQSKSLFNTAKMIAENREIAGLHYRSDTEVGKELAKKVSPGLEKVFSETIGAAKEEWKDIYPQPSRIKV